MEQKIEEQTKNQKIKYIVQLKYFHLLTLVNLLLKDKENCSEVKI